MVLAPVNCTVFIIALFSALAIGALAEASSRKPQGGRKTKQNTTHHIYIFLSVQMHAARRMCAIPGKNPSKAATSNPFQLHSREQMTWNYYRNYHRVAKKLRYN